MISTVAVPSTAVITAHQGTRLEVNKAPEKRRKGNKKDKGDSGAGSDTF